MKKFAVIVAAGSGTRMGNSIPKQFLDLSGKPILLHTLDAFLASDADLSIILVVHSDHLETARQLLNQAAYPAGIMLVAGGATRSASVQAGLQFVPNEAIVLVHDAARCLVSPDLIRTCCRIAEEKGSAVPAVAVADSVRVITENGSKSLDRNNLRLVQTPQTFQAHLLKLAYSKAGGKDFSDDASVLEYAGIPVHLVEGEATNIKITHPIDLKIALQLKKYLSA
jgi:2-C-methyl-D-erythritol 4-phosphate cytidylyltransferase